MSPTELEDAQLRHLAMTALDENAPADERQKAVAVLLHTAIAYKRTSACYWEAFEAERDGRLRGDRSLRLVPAVKS